MQREDPGLASVLKDLGALERQGKGGRGETRLSKKEMQAGLHRPGRLSLCLIQSEPDKGILVRTVL